MVTVRSFQVVFWGSGRQGTVVRIKCLEDRLNVYASKHQGIYPTTAEGFPVLSQYMGPRFPGDELDLHPRDAWGREILYFSPGIHGDHPYEIISYGLDGKEGGKGIDADLQSWNFEADGGPHMRALRAYRIKQKL